MNSTSQNKSFFWAVVVIWGGLILWNLFTPHEAFSEAENRYLKVFPKFTVSTLLNGEFMEDVDTYLNDHFAGRPIWVSGQSMIEYVTGKREISKIFVGKTALQGHMDAADNKLTLKNIEGINAFQEKYKLPTYAMLIPSSTDIQSYKLPKFAGGWDEKSYIDGVYQQLNEKVTTVNIYDVLKENSDEYIYYNTDHHWTSSGAYLAYHELAAKMGLPVHSRVDFNITEISRNFFGTYHSKTGFPFATADIIEVYQHGEVRGFSVFDGKETTEKGSIYFNEFLPRKDKYSYFLGQVQPYVTIKTASTSGKKLIIFKDSYAHCLVPMLLDDFSEIRLVDLRFINPMTMDKLLEIENYNEVLFLYSTDVFSHQLGTGLLKNAAE